MPEHVRKQAQNLYDNFFCHDPRHRILGGKEINDLHANHKSWRVEIGRSVRALAKENNEDGVTVFVWYWIGTHEAYNNRIGK